MTCFSLTEKKVFYTFCLENSPLKNLRFYSFLLLLVFCFVSPPSSISTPSAIVHARRSPTTVVVVVVVVVVVSKTKPTLRLRLCVVWLHDNKALDALVNVL